MNNKNNVLDNNRLPFLDIAKGIGILMVMYSHSLYNDAMIMTYVSGCYIPLFFVISGYLAKPTTGGGISFIGLNIFSAHISFLAFF